MKKSQNCVEAIVADFTSIPEYDIKGADSNLWEKALNWDYDWSNITAEKITENLENMVKNVFKKKVPDKGKTKDKLFRSKNLIPRRVRTLLRRKKEASKDMKKATTTDRCKWLKNKIKECDKELLQSDFNRRKEDELKAIDRMKFDKDYFEQFQVQSPT